MEINLQNISVNYEDNVVLKHVDLEVQKGEFISILGRNGSGKSTIIKAINQSTKVNSGKVLLLNEEINRISKRKLAQKIAYLLQFNSLIENITVYDYVAYGRTPFKKVLQGLNHKDDEIIMNSLEKTGLLSFKNRRLNQLSGGEKQRVYLAMCLAKQPEIIILDEPTNHLDIKYQYDLLKLIKKINQEQSVTVICVLHDLNQAIKFSDRLVMLKSGSVHQIGTINECITKQNIYDVFGVNAEIHQEDSGLHVDYLI